MLGIIGTFIGGLGLFLLAVSMITDGLKLAAGDALRGILQRSTSTPLRGVASGVLVTGIVQSSSAVTVATIGFVNAGLLTLSQSLGVIYGANIGTTITGWIVAAVGFSFKVEAFALPLIGIGMLSRVMRPASRIASFGEALAGFGLFFIGVDVLKEAFEVFSQNVDVASVAPQGGLGIVVYVALGFFMTLVTQSSSAAIAITLTAATGGVLGISAAAAMVIGANVGTTSTAAFAVVGATANARRVAAAHVVFNLLTGVVALLMLPLLLWLVRAAGTRMGLDDAPAVTLALFHTSFNVLGVILMWPLTRRLAQFLAGHFVTPVERLSRPQYLDQSVLAAPALAMDAIRLELVRASTLTRDVVATSISVEGTPGTEVRARMEGARLLSDEIEAFVTRLEMERLPEALRGNLPLVLRVTGYLDEINGLVKDLDEHRADISEIVQLPAGADVSLFAADVLAHVAACDPQAEDFTLTALQESYKQLRERWHTLKTTLLTAAASRHLPVSHLNPALEGLRSYLKMAEQLTKAVERTLVLDAQSTDISAQAVTA